MSNHTDVSKNISFNQANAILEEIHEVFSHLIDRPFDKCIDAFIDGCLSEEREERNDAAKQLKIVRERDREFLERKINTINNILGYKDVIVLNDELITNLISKHIYKIELIEDMK